MKKSPSTTETFEQLLAARKVRHVFRLYVGGTKPHSIRALQAIKQLCEEHLSGSYELEIIDVFQDKIAAKDHQIVAVPTLVRLEPLPVRRFVGDLTDKDRILSGFALIGNGVSK